MLEHFITVLPFVERILSHPFLQRRTHSIAVKYPLSLSKL